MLILAKAMMAIMLGFIGAIITGSIIIPLFKKLHIGQTILPLISETHLKKEGTPTMGGFIFIIPVLLSLLYLYIKGSINLSYNLAIVLFIFLSYALIGFLDDYIKVRHNNKKLKNKEVYTTNQGITKEELDKRVEDNIGFPTVLKFICQMAIALIFFILFLKGGGSQDLTFSFLNINIKLDWFFGIFIFVLLVGTSNAVNITDGLDGLAGGLSAIAFLAYGIIAWNCGWLEGYQEIAIFSFILVGALIGFLMFNGHPAKIFMGDMGSLALGATLATIAILTRHEFSLALIGGVFLIEILSSFIQIIAIRRFKKRIFKKAPLHHHFEELKWEETSIVKLFWTVGLIFAMIAIAYGVWL